MLTPQKVQIRLKCSKCKWYTRRVVSTKWIANLIETYGSWRKAAEFLIEHPIIIPCSKCKSFAVLYRIVSHYNANVETHYGWEEMDVKIPKYVSK
jgi:hypothetical protein